MAVDKKDRAKFERTSFGTAKAQAARRSVPASMAAKVVARSGVSGRYVQKKTTKSDG
jgi:hypothetical protein